MLPDSKAMVDRLKNEPFALIGINSDGDAARVKEIMAKEGLTWRNAVDGSPDGPWAKAWNIQGWPTLYVLDATGKIVAKDPDHDSMLKAVDKAIAEAKAAAESASKAESKPAAR